METDKIRKLLDELTFPLLLKRYREQLLFGRFEGLHLKKEILQRFEDLQCCGNCKLYRLNECEKMGYEPMFLLPKVYPASGYCKKYQFDDLSLVEREKK